MPVSPIKAVNKISVKPHQLPRPTKNAHMKVISPAL